MNGSAFRVSARSNMKPLNRLEKWGMETLWKINIFLKVQDSTDRAFSNFQLYSSRGHTKSNSSTLDCTVGQGEKNISLRFPNAACPSLQICKGDEQFILIIGHFCLSEGLKDIMSFLWILGNVNIKLMLSGTIEFLSFFNKRTW